MKRCDLRVNHGVVGNGQRDVNRGRIADMDTPWTPRLDLERPAIGRFPLFPAVTLAAAVTLTTAAATGITAMLGSWLQLCYLQLNSRQRAGVLPSRTAALAS